MQHKYDFDFIVIGSGFGGSVSAHRLTEKGYRVGVMEMGKRYDQTNFPKSNWNARKFLWVPQTGLHGFFRMTLFRHTFVLSGVGVGGGSLVYACTLLVPPDTVWQDTQWAHLKDWKTTMPQFYDTAKQILGVTNNPYLGKADKLLRAAADEQGFGDTFYRTDVSIYFGEKGETVPDPYFGGDGPARTGCTYCGGCMTGCLHGAKNSLDKNYLYFAEKHGAQVMPESQVVDIIPLNGRVDGRDGYEIHVVTPTSIFKNRRVYTTRGIVFSAGVLGTVKLMFELKQKGSLPKLSARTGDFIRTNSEAIIGVQLNEKGIDISEGVAIGSGVHVDEYTHIEAVRYSKGDDAMGALTTLLTGSTPGIPRLITWLGTVIKHPLKFLKSLNPIGFARSTVILLVMQTLEGTIKMRLKRGLFGNRLVTEGEQIPSFIPAANQFAERMAQQFNGTPKTALTEILFDVPTTAHILGGAAMAANPDEGVIDSQNRVFNYKNMYVCDGSMIGANLGVNPSLTITALTEHAMSHIKPAHETDWNESGQITQPDNQIFEAA